MSDLNVDDFLKTIGVGIGGGRVPLNPDPDSVLTKGVDGMVTFFKNRPEGGKQLELYAAALKLFKLGSVFDMTKTSAPPEVAKSIHDLLNYYIHSAVENFELDDKDKVMLIDGLRRLVSMSVQMGYIYRAMESDGRWGDLTNLPL